MAKTITTTMRDATYEGTEFFLVKHTGSGHQYLAEQSVVDSIENSELDQQMDDLATEEGM